MPKKTKPAVSPIPRLPDSPAPPPLNKLGYPADPPTLLGTLDQLAAAVAQPIDCVFEMNGRMVRIAVHRLMPAQTDQIEAVRRAVPTPPLIKGKTQLEDRYDTENVAYRDQVLQANRVARALTIYFGCPLFAKARPGLTDRNLILAFVENPQQTEVSGQKSEVGASPAITNVILEIIYLSIAGEAIKVREELNQRVNF